MESNENQSEYYDLVLTDAGLHTALPSNPKPWYSVFTKILRTKKPARAYTKDVTISKNRIVTACFPLSPEWQAKVEAAKKAGKKVRVIVPEGTPLRLGKDAQEYLTSIQRKRKGLWKSNFDKRDIRE